MKYKMINIDIMLFDVDGTLVDSRADIADAVNFTLKELGLEQRLFNEIVSYIGRGVKDLLARSLGDSKKMFLEQALSIFGAYYSRHSADKTTPYKNVFEVLEHFEKKRKFIVTNRNKDFADLTLRQLGLLDHFEGIVGGDDEACVKPSACPINNVLSLDNFDKKKAIMIGDMDVDILAGKNAGVFTCGVTYGIGKRKDIIKAKPDYIIDDISELKHIIS